VADVNTVLFSGMVIVSSLKENVSIGVGVIA
jgi:hypothetical protein